MRWQHRMLMIFMPLLVAGVSAESAAPATVNKDAAIAIFKKQCGSGGPGFGPYDELEAQLEGDHWHVHASFPSAHPEIDPNTRFKDLYLDIPVDGTPPKGKCYGTVVE
jgi:hypothetical protein